MTRLIVFLLGVVAIAAGLHWLADRPGTIVIEWQDYVAETTVFRAFVILAVVFGAALAVWSLLRQIWASPAAIGRLLQRRRQKRGLDALSSGIIAIGAGDRTLALRYAGQARKALPNEPLTHLLRAQAAHLTGDRATSRRIFEAMLASRDTEQLGLRGLFLEAQREGAQEAARQFAERAMALNPKLGWPVEALFDIQCKAGDWQGALDTLAVGRRHSLIDKATASRRRAVLLTAQAQAGEDGAAEKALALALEAHRLAPDLVPAAAIAGRILASQGNTPRAARVLLKTWRLSPHPDLAAAYAYVRPGDSPRDRLVRVRHLGRLTPNNSEAPIALAISAIEAREWTEARQALEPLLDGRLSQRVCTLMARIEAEEHGHTGRVREWLARAVNAPRDPVWTADGVVSDRWAPASPVTGALDAFQWRVPVEAIDEPAGALLAAKVEALVGLGASETMLEHAPQPARATAPVATTVTTAPQEAPPVAATNSPPAKPAEEVVTAKPAPPEPLPPKPAEPQLPAAAARTMDAPAEKTETAQPARTARTQPGEQRSGAAAETSRAGAPPRRVHKVVEPKIFVPPRAPDDPGPEPTDADGLEPEPFHPSPAKA
ncbi:MAG: heme biosynthesis protein HemY [Hyphomicrobiaceae bacterium]|nr:MAG: heme biosynthesis protein HemY [Hyphomicrobiaceae bacterium]